MRKLILPEAKSQSMIDGVIQGPKWGLSEFMLEALLPAPENLSSVENCDRVFSLNAKFDAHKGPAQGGVGIELTDSEYEFLVKRWQPALVAFCGPTGRLSMHLTSDFALYARALFAATPVNEESAPA